MSCDGGRFTIVYNGELYNFNSIRQRLQRAGQVFRTQSDTEVILNGFSAQAQQSLSQLNGIFAFAIWDAVRSSLFLARDHLGIKPLYYAKTDDFFVFGSEIKAIFASDLVAKRVNEKAMFDYLCRQAPPYLDTMFEGVYELEPGTWMEVLASGEIKSGKYFHLEDDWRQFEGLPSTETDVTQLVEERIELSVQRQLISDVPVGIALSGGMDSAIVYSYMSKEYPETLHAFTYANTASEINEFGKAADVIEHLGGRASHHVTRVDVSDSLRYFKEASRLLDSPVAYQSSIPVLLISRHASRHGIKVLMSGQGGDELFLGYERYLRWIDQGLLDEESSVTWAENLYFGSGIGNVEQVERVTGVSKKYIETSPIYQWAFENQDLPPLKRMAIFDQKFRLMYLLKRDDRMGMGGSVEIRVPFLDRELVSLVNALDDGWKLNGRNQKYLLKRIGRHILPASVINSRKLGSPVDFLYWIDTPEFSEKLEELITDEQSLSRRFLDRVSVTDLLSEHKETHKYSYLIRCLFSLENWYRACFLDSGYPR